MTMIAAEEAAPMAAGAGAGGDGAAAGIAGQAAGQASQSKGTMLAIAILLFWLAGVLFFIAFEGSGILGENPPANSKGGVSWFKAAMGGLTSIAADTASGDTGGLT